MSGPMPQSVASAASRAAGLAKLAAVRAEIAGRANDRQEGAAAIWARIPERTRAVLVMLGTKKMGDPRFWARHKWAELSPEDQAGLGSVARALVRELAGVEALR